MKRKYNTVYMMIALIALVIGTGIFIPRMASSKIVTNVEPDISSEQLKAIVIEDFEKDGDIAKWKIESVPKKLTNPKNPDDNPVDLLEMKVIDGSPSDLIPEKWAENDKGKTAKKCLGFRFKFKYPGYNSVHLVPGDGIMMPGRSKALSLWFHGRGYDYTLEAWIKDFRGNTHVLKFGSINFVGWRPLKSYIPESVPQKTDSYPQTRFLKLTRIVVRAQPDALVNETYMFIDQIKVLTDDYEVHFDGRELHEKFGKSKDEGSSATKGSKDSPK